MSKIHLVFGSQGAGKSTYAKQLAEQVKGVHFSIDEWMWDLYGNDLPKPMDMAWIMERVDRCEKQIWVTAKQIALRGGNVILDLAFTKVKHREKYINLANDHNIPIQLHYVNAPKEVRTKRVMQRNAEKGKTFSFEVTPAMFEFMEMEFEKPTQAELDRAIVVDTTEGNI